jgi:vacuolar-type H+-ATPase subunit H
MSEAAVAPGEGAGSIESLKAVRTVEVETAARLTKLKADGAAVIQRLAEEAEAAVLAARAAAVQAREATLTAARAKADAEATQLLADGRKEAQAIEVRAAQSVAAKRDAVLSIVLGPFRGK